MDMAVAKEEGSKSLVINGIYSPLRYLIRGRDDGKEI